jgi:hypothetical protein
MEKVTDWLKLWEELSKIQDRAFGRKKKQKDDDF